MSDLLLQLAHNKFDDLNPAEERFLQAVAEGRFLDFSTPVVERAAPHEAHLLLEGSPDGASSSDSSASINRVTFDAAQATEGRVVRADRIVWLATDGARFVTHRGIGLKGAKIEGRLDLQAANIVFSIYFERCQLLSGINLLGAEIHALNLSGCEVGRISADGMKVEAGVFLRTGFRSNGRVRLCGAEIGGNLDCDGGQFINPGGEALAADGVKVQGSISLGAGFRAEGQVRLPGAAIGGSFNCSGGARAARAIAAAGDRAIGGSFNCSGGAFLNPAGDALLADRLKVDGNVFFCDGFQAAGKVALPGAQIAAYLVHNGVKHPEQTTLDLRSAHVGTLWMERASWPARGKLLLHGLTYDEMDERAAVDSATRVAWLQLQPPVPFRPQPYEQLAAVLRKDGYTDEAKRILYSKEVDRAKRTRLSWSEWPWYRLFGPLIGYGYKPFRAFWLAVAVVLLGTVLFNLGARAGLMTPAKAEAFADPKAGGQINEFYPKLQPFMYSLDTFTPLISLDQADFWLPNAERGQTISCGPVEVTTGSLLRSYMWFHVVAGWILSTLLFVGLTGSVPGA